MRQMRYNNAKQMAPPSLWTSIVEYQHDDDGNNSNILERKYIADVHEHE